jgi:hypothetical protein
MAVGLNGTAIPASLMIDTVYSYEREVTDLRGKLEEVNGKLGNKTNPCKIHS